MLWAALLIGVPLKRTSAIWQRQRSAAGEAGPLRRFVRWCFLREARRSSKLPDPRHKASDLTCIGAIGVSVRAGEVRLLRQNLLPNPDEGADQQGDREPSRQQQGV